MSRKGSSSDSFGIGDLTFAFRKQEPRSLHEIDMLIKRQASIRKIIGEEKANDIETAPDLYYNAERFRIW